MKWINDAEFMDRVTSMIRRRATGDAGSLGEKLNMSKRNVHRLICEMRNFGFPVKYCIKDRTYFFEEDVKYEFTIKVGEKDLLKIKGGKDERRDLIGFENL
ncbi:MAG: hypothetical protein IPM42_21085 [Saprospiraceae bacterium]|nr:hypothetical protein [Saprospiraceae bacterium]